MRTAERRALLIGALPALLLAMVGGTAGLLAGGVLFLAVAGFTYLPNRRLGGVTTLRWSIDEARFRQLARHPLGTRAWEAGIGGDGPVPVEPPPTVGPVAWFRGAVRGEELGVLYSGGAYLMLLEVTSDGGDPDPAERDAQAASWSGVPRPAVGGDVAGVPRRPGRTADRGRTRRAPALAGHPRGPDVPAAADGLLPGDRRPGRRRSPRITGTGCCSASPTVSRWRGPWSGPPRPGSRPASARCCPCCSGRRRR